MRKIADSQVYEAIQNARLSEAERCTTLAAAEKAESITNAIVWAVKCIRNMRFGARVRGRANEGAQS